MPPLPEDFERAMILAFQTGKGDPNRTARFLNEEFGTDLTGTLVQLEGYSGVSRIIAEKVYRRPLEGLIPPRAAELTAASANPRVMRHWTRRATDILALDSLVEQAQRFGTEFGFMVTPSELKRMGRVTLMRALSLHLFQRRR